MSHVGCFLSYHFTLLTCISHQTILGSKLLSSYVKAERGAISAGAFVTFAVKANKVTEGKDIYKLLAA